MKIKFLFSLSLLALLLACSSNSDSNNNLNNNFIAADIDGVNRSFDGLAALDYNNNSGYFFTTIYSFTKEFEDGKRRDIYIDINLPPMIGTYQFNDNGISSDASASYRVWDSNQDLRYYSINGSVTITEFTQNKIVGTFSFEATLPNNPEVVTLENGAFNAKIVTVSGQVWNGLN